MSDFKLVKLIDPITLNLGEFRLMGEFDPLTEYSAYDVVSYEGTSYIAKQDTTGNLPTNTIY
jgi:hypothetical protein